MFSNPTGKPILRILSVFLFLALFSGCTNQQESPKTTGNVKPGIVSLAPSVTEMIYAVGAGDQLIGRTSACDWPTEAENVQVVGAFGKPSLEILAALHPDIVLDVDLADEQNGKKSRHSESDVSASPAVLRMI